MAAALTTVVATAAWAPPAARVQDTAQSLPHVHNPQVGPRVGVGPILTGSPNVLISGRPAARVQDTGSSPGCGGPSTFTIISGSNTVLINGRPAARMGDQTMHCGVSAGTIIQGEP
ncbi:MAG: hypothetical protein GF393_00140, partial [Armatimonadia bacterium]|nr:hypothetical protein [Armatimonadia bacterium]